MGGRVGKDSSKSHPRSVSSSASLDVTLSPSVSTPVGKLHTIQPRVREVH